MKNTRSLRARLSWYMVLTMLLMTTLSGGGIYIGTMHEAEEIFGASLIQTARILEGVMTRKLIESSSEHLLQSMAATDLDTGRVDEVGEYEEKLFFAVIDQSGQVLLKSPFAPTLPDRALPTGFVEFESDGKAWYSFNLDSRHDDLRIVVGESNELRDELSESILNGLLWPLVLMLPIIIALLLYLIKLALTPLNRIGDELRGQHIQHLKPIEAEGIPSEINPLVSSLNQMIEGLDQAYQRERRFVSDASHELRNPLAALLINIENALEENNDPGLSDSLNAMHRSTQRLVHLVAQLLQLSHSENPLVQKCFEAVDLQRVCRMVSDRQQASARANQQLITCVDSQTPCVIQGSETLLQSLLTNLVENAIRYAGEGSRIQLGCVQRGDEHVLTVEDSGPGVSDELLEKIVDRFFRGNAYDTKGAGLGLSIVQVIAESHNARLELGRSALGGLRVSVLFANASQS
jgi:two-component system sensor histidine kinase QseC